MQTLSTQEFKDKVFDYEANKEWSFKGSKPVVLDFFAEWCGPCKRLTPTLEQMSKEYNGNVEFYKIDIDAEPDLASAFGIMSVPTLLFIPTSGEPQMAQGALPKDTLQKAIKDILGVNAP